MTDKKKQTGCKKVLKSLSKNYWTLSTILLAVVLIAVLSMGGTEDLSISSDIAGEKVIEWASGQVSSVEMVSITEEGGLYAVTFSYANPETAATEEATLQITKDGSSLILQAIPLETQATEIQTQPDPTQTQPEPPTSYSEEDLTKLKEFNDCLGEAGLKIYGADWCGWTKKLAVETLGGFDTASAIYVECTVEEELCASEGIQGYPTIKLNGEPYNGERTIEALSQATQCPAPELTGTVTTDSSTEGNC